MHFKQILIIHFIKHFESMTDSGKILTAITVGAVAGLITGILIAPDKGSEISTDS